MKKVKLSTIQTVIRKNMHMVGFNNGALVISCVYPSGRHKFMYNIYVGNHGETTRKPNHIIVVGDFRPNISLSQVNIKCPDETQNPIVNYTGNELTIKVPNLIDMSTIWVESFRAGYSDALVDFTLTKES